MIGLNAQTTTRSEREREAHEVFLGAVRGLGMLLPKERCNGLELLLKLLFSAGLARQAYSGCLRFSVEVLHGKFKCELSELSECTKKHKTHNSQQ
jgi:hypothetical protein